MKITHGNANYYTDMKIPNYDFLVKQYYFNSERSKFT